LLIIFCIKSNQFFTKYNLIRYRPHFCGKALFDYYCSVLTISLLEFGFWRINPCSAFAEGTFEFVVATHLIGLLDASSKCKKKYFNFLEYSQKRPN